MHINDIWVSQMFEKILFIKNWINRSLSYYSKIIFSILIYFDLAISLRAYSYLFYFISTRHTRPKPPLPITYKNLNECFPIPEGTLIASFRGDSYDVFREWELDNIHVDELVDPFDS